MILLAIYTVNYTVHDIVMYCELFLLVCCEARDMTLEMRGVVVVLPATWTAGLAGTGGGAVKTKPFKYYNCRKI